MSTRRGATENLQMAGRGAGLERLQSTVVFMSPLIPYSPAIQPHFRVGPWHCVCDNTRSCSVLCIVCLLHSGAMLVVGLLLFGCSGIGTTCNNCRGKTNEKGEKVWVSLTESEYEQPN